MHHIKAGAYVDHIVLGKTTMHEIDSVNSINGLKAGFISGGGVSYVENSGGSYSFYISCKDLAGHLSVVFPGMKDASEPAAAAQARYAKTLAATVLVNVPAVAIDPKGLQLTGKTAQQIRAAYPKSVLEDYKTYIDDQLLIDYASGIAFLFDHKTKKCICVEVFNGKYCFSKAYSESLKNAIKNR